MKNKLATLVFLLFTLQFESVIAQTSIDSTLLSKEYLSIDEGHVQATNATSL
jgi:hypothetical protein